MKPKNLPRHEHLTAFFIAHNEASQGTTEAGLPRGKAFEEWSFTDLGQLNINRRSFPENCGGEPRPENCATSDRTRDTRGLKKSNYERAIPTSH
jgi:hypothetical protein